MNKIIGCMGIFGLVLLLAQCKEPEPDPVLPEQKSITYADTGWNGINVIHMDDSVIIDSGEFKADMGYSFSADLKAESVLKIVITNFSTDEYAYWWYSDGGRLGWSITNYDDVKKRQEFYAVKTGHLDLSVMFTSFGSCRIDYYENNDTAASRTKYLTWK